MDTLFRNLCFKLAVNATLSGKIESATEINNNARQYLHCHLRVGIYYSEVCFGIFSISALFCTLNLFFVFYSIENSITKHMSVVIYRQF